MHKHVEYFALCINGSPQIYPLTNYRDYHLIEVPGACRGGTLLPQVSRDLRAKLQTPAAYGLVADADVSFREQILDVAQTHREPEVSLHIVGDYLRWKAVPLVRYGVRELAPASEIRD
jgi:hypothetical protein